MDDKTIPITRFEHILLLICYQREKGQCGPRKFCIKKKTEQMMDRKSNKK